MDSAANVAEFLLQGKPADRVAIRVPQADFTYGDLQRASEELARRLERAGILKGERVLLLSANTFHWAASYLGVLRAGAVCVPLPGTISAEDLSYIVGATAPRAAFVQASLMLRYGALLTEAGVGVFHESREDAGEYFTGVPECRDRAGEQETAGDGLAALMFTSGSTGRPRGVIVTHRNIRANTTSIIEALSLSADDRMMVVLPFHYCFGTSLLHTYLRVGATLVLDNRFTYPEVILNRMAETECTGFAGVPSHYQILLRNSSLSKRRLPNLRSLLQAGGHLAPSFVQELQEVVPQAQIFVMYGQTEATARLACLPPSRLKEKAGSIGKAIPGVNLHVLRESGEPVSPGEIGEIVAEGENITLGYWQAPEDTSNSFREGRLYTGDLATVDEEGFIYVVDRAKEFIKCGGKRISCRQIEDGLLACNELLEAAVIAVPDEILGEAIRAFVVPRTWDGEDLIHQVHSFCKANLPRSLHPRDLIPIRALPKNSSGKVLRAQLRELSVSCPPESAQELAHTKA